MGTAILAVRSDDTAVRVGSVATPMLPDEDAELLRALRAGDEGAYMALVDKYGASLLRVAMMYVSSRAIAEEVVGDTWLAVVTGLERFEGRSSLKTWLFRILTNKAKTRGQREARTRPFSSFDGDEEGTAVDADRFARDGAWAAPPRGVPLPHDLRRVKRGGVLAPYSARCGVVEPLPRGAGVRAPRGMYVLTTT